MEEQAYQSQIQLIKGLEERGEFQEALKQCKKMIANAQPDQIEGLVTEIKELREKMKNLPKQVKLPSGFRKYDVKFSDAIGYKKHKRLLARWIGLPMLHPEKYTANKMPKSTGILIYGPPGTGKTLMGRCLSGEFGLPMKIIFVSDILDRVVGGSEKNMRQVFVDAKAVQPSLLFFDELDALGASRESANEFTSNDIRNTINEFLEQLSTLHDDKEQTVFVIGATNLPWQLDPAIGRSGRIEHHIFIGPPNLFDRRKIFRYYLQIEGTEYALKVNYTLLALASARYSQADIEKVCTAVKRHMIERNRSVITTHDIQRILRSKEEGASSLDAWILKAMETYIKKEKKIVHKTGFLGLKRQKERVEEQGNLNKADTTNYKPIINYLKRTKRWWYLLSVTRFIAQGI